MANGNGFNPQVAQTVLGSGTQPLNYLIQRRQREALDAQRKQALAQRQQQARDKNIATAMQINPDKAWEPYDKSIKGAANNIRQWTLGQIRQHGDSILNDPGFQAERARRIDEMNTIASGSQRVKGSFLAAQEALKGPKYNQDVAMPMLNNLVYAADGTPLGIDNTNLQGIESITSNPATFNKGYMAKQFVDTLGNRIDQFYRQKGEEGKRYFDIEKITRSALLDQDTETGTWRVNVTPEVIQVMKNDPDMNALLDYHKEQTGIQDDRAAATDLLKDYAGEIQRERRPGARVPTEDAATRKAREAQADADKRYEFVHTGLWEGDATKLKAAADMTEGVDVAFGYPEGPAPAPGQKRTPDKLLVTWNEFNLKGIPIPTTKEIDISTPQKLFEAEEIFNTLLNKKEVSGSKVGVDAFNQARDRYMTRSAGGVYPQGETEGAGGIY